MIKSTEVPLVTEIMILIIVIKLAKNNKVVFIQGFARNGTSFKE